MRAIACTCETKQNKTKKHHHLNKPSPQATNFMVSFYRKISYAPQTNLPFNINAISFIFCYFIKYYLVSHDISSGFTSFFFGYTFLQFMFFWVSIIALLPHLSMTFARFAHQLDLSHLLIKSL